MKSKGMVITILAGLILVGCQSQVTTDNRMKDVVDSEYTWYSKYINQYLVDIKEDSYKVNPNDIKSLIGELDSKIDEIKKLDTDKIKAAIDRESDAVSKNDKDDTKYKAEIKNVKANIGKNKESMLEILGMIRSGLELGQDGQFDQDDLKKISVIQSSLLKIYDENLKSY